MNYAVLGTGYWGENHVRVASELQESGVLDDVYLCDLDEERVAQLAEQYGFDYTTDYRDLADMGISAATVATPSTTHHEIATHLLDNGVDLLVEKPLALNSAEAWDIVEASTRNNQTLGVGHIFRYHPALNDLKDRIDRGELGQINYLYTTRFSFRVPRTTTGVLYSLAVHDVDIYRYLLDSSPDTVNCNLSSVVRPDVDEAATLTLGFDETLGVINESWQVPVFGKQRDLVVVGSERAAYIDYLSNTELQVFNSHIESRGEQLHVREEGSNTYSLPEREPLKLEVNDFLDAASNGTQPRASGSVGAATIELLEAAKKSDRTGRTIEPNLV